MILRLSVALSIALLAACQPATTEAPAAPEPQPEAATPGVVEVMVEDFSFLAPPTLASGWNTFRLTNHGEQPHFMLLWKLPEGVAFEDYAAFGRMFQEQFDGYFTGTATQEQMLQGIVGSLPEWFPQLRGMGGVALVSPGESAETVVLLEPGDYAMECYVISPEGQFHASLGMVRPLIVSEESTGAEPPAADVTITLSNYSMAVEGELSAGPHVVAVHATENAEGLIGHDVNLARLDEGTDIAAVAAWMNWIDALRPPAPALFLGGADHVGAARTSYFSIDLTPGRYAFLSEGYAAQGMVHEFVVE